MADKQTLTLEALRRSIGVVKESAESLKGFNNPLYRAQMKIMWSLQRRYNKLKNKQTNQETLIKSGEGETNAGSV